MALVSSKRARLQAAAASGSTGASAALDLLTDPTSFLSAIQIGITLIGILAGVYGGAAFSEHLAGLLAAAGLPERFADDGAYAVVVAGVTYLALIFGELVPKRVALSHAETLAIAVAPVMRSFTLLMTPFVWILRISVELVLKLVPVAAAPHQSVTEDEVRQLIAEAVQHGVFLSSERKLVDGVLALADRKVESIMVPRPDVVWLDLDEPLSALWDQASASGHARFLVAHGDLDQLVGTITLAKLSEALRRGLLDETADIEAPLHVPESVSILKLLGTFQSSRTHFALITDEYGEVVGIATPVDVLRAIAGELRDLGSRERPEALKREDGSWLVDGHLPIDDLQQLLKRRDMAGRDYHTVAGFLLTRLGRIPKAGDTLVWRDLKVEVVDMDGMRIDKLAIVKMPVALIRG